MTDKVINLILRVKQDGEAVLQKIKRETVDAADAVNKLNQTGSKIGANMGGAQGVNAFKDLTGAINGTKDGAERLFGALKNLAIGFVGLQIVQTIKNFADVAARTESLGTVLDVVAVNAGISAGKIHQVDAEVQKLGITSQASKQALIAFIQAGLDVSKAAPLARAAQDLAVIAGKNSSDLFQNIILNIQQLDTQGLRYNGVVLDMDEVTARYAKSIGKTASELNNQQKQQAVLIGTLDKAKEVQGVYEKSLGDVGKQVQSLKRYQQEAAESISKNALPAYRVLVEEFTTFLKQSKLVTDEWNEQGTGAKGLAENIRPIAAALREVAVFVVEHIAAISELVVAYASLTIIASVISNLTVLTTVVIGATVAFKGMFVALTAAAAANPPLFVAIVAIAAALQAGVIIWDHFAAKKKEALDASTAKGLVAATATQAEVEETLTDKLTLRRDMVSKISLLESKLVDAKKAGNVDEQAALEAQLKTGKEREAQVVKQIADLKKLAQARGGTEAIDRTEEQARINLEARNTEQALKNVDDAFKDLKISSDQMTTGKDVSTEFRKQFSAATTIFNAFKDNLKRGDSQIANFGGLRAMFNGISSGAKSVDELKLSLDFLTKAAKDLGVNSALLNDLIDTTKFRLQKATIDELKKSLEGYAEAQKQAKDQLDLVFSLQQDSTRFTQETTKAFADLGAIAAVSSRGLVSFYSLLGSNLTEKNASLRQEVALFTLSKEAALNKYTLELAALQDTAAKRKTQVNSEIADEADKRVRMVAIDREAAVERLAATKTYYDAVQGLQKQLQQAVIDSGNKIKGFEQERLNLTLRKEQVERDARRAGMTEEQRKADDQQRFSELDLKVQEAISGKKIEAAKRAADEQLKIAEALQSSATTEEQRRQATNEMNSALDNQTKIVNAQEDEEKKRFRTLADQLNEVTTKAEGLRSSLVAISSSIKLDIDTTGFEGVVAKLRDSIANGLKDIPISLRAAANAASFAMGGLIRGPGTATSDSILLRGSDGEYMMNAQATAFYGEDAMRRINRMELPRFAQGGPIGGSTSVAPSETSLSLTFNGRQLGKVRGKRETVRGLVDALTELSRGVS